ncbi:MAG: hypothetical protein CVU56_02950 [Deltaproteobacteria bacterium HGW-Deltaproteobacteria-14]|jgi:hypothetical protein|nr:MAG: hypothetical protein CVU56_02950 [Deltaproteobacteria bacterium HGW-Deltaproteobacteria-14]
MLRPHRTLPLVAALLALATSAPPARAGDIVPIPGIRVTGGAVWHVDPERDVVGAVDILPNIQVLNPDAQTLMTLMLGYGFEGGGDSHFFLIGADIGYLPSVHFGASVGLRGVLGSADGDLGGGMRVVVGTDLFYGVFRIEGGYQLLTAGHGAEHDLRVTAGIDVLRMLAVPFLVMAENL